MSSTNLVAVLFLFFSIVLLGESYGQEITAKPDFGEGALEEVSPRMEKLLALGWDEENLVLKRAWNPLRMDRKEKAAAAKRAAAAEKDELAERIEAHVERGVPDAQAENMAEAEMKIADARKRIRNMKRFHTAPVDKVFFSVASEMGPRSSSGNLERRKLEFTHDSLLGEASMLSDNLRFRFTERKGDERSFELWDNGEGRLKFEFSFDELFVRFLQTEAGKTQLIWIASDKVDVYVGDSFSDFVKRNPQAATELLLPLFNRLGIKKPISKTDPEVLSLAIARLQNQAGPESEKLARLFKDLDSRSFKTREQAVEGLSEGYEQWSGQIIKYSENEDISLEARVRLKDLIGKNSEGEIASLINAQNLLSSPEFLVAALEFAEGEQKALVATQLEKVTEQTHGTDLQAWQDWLETSK